MIVNILIVLFFMFLWYAYIWSGNCRLCCQQSDVSRYSGLSGLEPNGPTAHTSRSHPSSHCVCDSCPCALIQNVLSMQCRNRCRMYVDDLSAALKANSWYQQVIHIYGTCSPAVNVYTHYVDLLADCLVNFTRTITDACHQLVRVAECGTSCQNQARVVDSDDSHSREQENFIFEKETKENIPTKKGIASQIKFDVDKLKASKSNDEIQKNIEQTNRKEAGPRGKASFGLASPSRQASSVKKDKSNESVKPTEASGNSRVNCKTCVKKGKVCVSGCPGPKNNQQ